MISILVQFMHGLFAESMKSHNIKNVTMVDAEKRREEIKEFVEGKCKEIKFCVIVRVYNLFL